MGFDPEMLYKPIRHHMTDFNMRHQLDPLKQSIASSLPDSLDDSCARKEWGWNPNFNLESMTADMLEKLKIKFL